MIRTISILHTAINKALTQSLDIGICPDTSHVLVWSNENRTTDICGGIDTVTNICLAVSRMVRLVIGEHGVPRYDNIFYVSFHIHMYCRLRTCHAIRRLLGLQDCRKLLLLHIKSRCRKDCQNLNDAVDVLSRGCVPADKSV